MIISITEGEGGRFREIEVPWYTAKHLNILFKTHWNSKTQQNTLEHGKAPWTLQNL